MIYCIGDPKSSANVVPLIQSLGKKNILHKFKMAFRTGSKILKRINYTMK